MSRAVRVLDALAALALALAVAASLARPIFYWDSWAYHLPFSALLLDIGGARSNFVLSEEIRWRYEGFPLAAEYLQGLLWKATGTINATALVNSAALAAFAVVAARALKASFALLVFGALAFPLIAMHAVSAYIDLFVGACIAFQALAAVKMEAAARRRDGRLLVWCAVYVASAALAGNSKVTGLVLSGAIGAFVAGYAILRGPSFGRRRAVLLAVAVGAVLAGASAFKNLAQHGNPVYPIAATVAGYTLPGPEPEYRSYPKYTAALGPIARPVNWALSITQIDWRIRGINPGYTLDAHTGQGSADDLPARTGGLWPPAVVGSLALVVWLASRSSRRDPGAFREQRFLVWLFAFVTIVTAFMPQSHELRYSLHWPLLLVLVVAVLARSALDARGVATIALAYLAASVATQHMVDYTFRPWPIETQAHTIADQTRNPHVAEVRARGAVCLGPEYQPRQFAYAAVFHGGSYVVEQGWTKCERYKSIVRGSKPPPSQPSP